MIFDSNTSKYFFYICRRLVPWFLLLTVYCVVVGYIVERYDFLTISWGTEAAAVNAVIIGVLLGMRNRSAFDRWWEARRLWGQLVNDSRNLATKVRAFVPAAAINDAKFPLLLSTFPVALMQHLRWSDNLQDLPGFENEPAHPKHVPLYLAGRVMDGLATWQREGLIDPVTTLNLDTQARGLLDVCGGCERIKTTPIVASHKTILRAGIVANLMLAPWFEMLELGFWGIGVILAAGFFLLGVEVIDTVIEDPFGTEPDDLPLERYCKTIENSIDEIFAAPTSPAA